MLKKVMASKLEPLLRTGVSRIQKVEWTGAFVKAYEEAFRAKNIIGGFHGTGIHPYVPSKVLRQVSDPTLLDLQLLQIPPHRLLLPTRRFLRVLQLISTLFEQKMRHLISYFSLENRSHLPQRNILIVSLGLPNGILPPKPFCSRKRRNCKLCYRQRKHA